MASEPLQCSACGRIDDDVKVKLVRSDQLVKGRVRPVFETSARCRDVEACKERSAVGT